MALKFRGPWNALSQHATQFELDVLAPRAYGAQGAERTRLVERVEQLLAANATLRVDLAGLAFVRIWPRMSFLVSALPQHRRIQSHSFSADHQIGGTIADWDNGCSVTVSGSTL